MHSKALVDKRGTTAAVAYNICKRQTRADCHVTVDKMLTGSLWLLTLVLCSAAMKVWGPLHDPDEVQQALAGNSPDAVSSSSVPLCSQSSLPVPASFTAGDKGLCFLVPRVHTAAAQACLQAVCTCSVITRCNSTPQADIVLCAVQILAAGLLTMCQTCRWLVGLSRQQARKLAVAHGKEAARAAKAAKAAAGEDDGDDAPDLQIETEDEVSGDEAEDEMMAENEEDVADAAGEPLMQRRGPCVVLQAGG
jgi:hypothetical protein